MRNDGRSRSSSSDGGSSMCGGRAGSRSGARGAGCGRPDHAVRAGPPRSRPRRAPRSRARSRSGGRGERLLGQTPGTGSRRAGSRCRTASAVGGALLLGGGTRCRGAGLLGAGVLGTCLGAVLRGDVLSGHGTAALEAGCDDGHADLVAQGVIDDGAEDDVRIRVSGLLDQACRLRDLVQAEVAAALDGERERRRRRRSRPRAADWRPRAPPPGGRGPRPARSRCP